MSDQSRETGAQVHEAAGGVRARAEGLLRQMTPAEKAGQLTQYFYFRLPAAPDDEPALGVDPEAQPRRSRTRSRAEASARCCSRPIPPRSTASSGSRSRATAWASRRCSVTTSSTACGPSSRCRSRWPRPGTPRRSNGPGGRRPGGPRGRHPLGLRAHGRHRPRPALGPDHRGRGRGPVPRRGRGGGAGPRLPGRRLRPAGADHRRAPSTSPATATRSAAGTTTRSTCPTHELWNVDLPAVPGRGRGRRGQRDDGYMDLNGVPATRQPLAVHGGAARHAGLRGVRGQRRQRRAQPASPTASPPT